MSDLDDFKKLVLIAHKECNCNCGTKKRKFPDEASNLDDFKILVLIAHKECNCNCGTKKRKFPDEVSDVLHGWMKDNLDNPYPTEHEKRNLMQKTQLTMTQINNWFSNVRRRQYKKIKK